MTCSQEKCSAQVHVRCGYKNGWSLQKENGRCVMYCLKHTKRKKTLERNEELSKEIKDFCQVTSLLLRPT